MATLVGNNVIVTGTKYARVRVEWQLAGQNVGGNFSTINWQAYVDFVGCDAQLDDGYVGWNGGGLYDNGGRVYNYAGNFSNHTVGMGSGSFNVGHDGNGNGSFSMNADVYVFQSGRSAAGGSWGLPRIPKPPSVQSNGIDTYTTSSVRAIGNVSDDGGAGLSERGFVYVAGTGTPSTGNSKINVGGGGGSFTAILSGLAPNTTYTARAYAVNSRGTTYGGNMTFTTYQNPAVTTVSVVDPAGTTATANGNLTNNGNPDITEKGFVYATTPNPTTANFKAPVAGATVGAYSANLTGLSPSSIYYIRAYATNVTGTFYGEELTFQTVVAPTLRTDPAENVTTTSALGRAEVLTDGGGTISERGFVLATTANPTTANIKVVDEEGGLGEYTTAITGLTPSTTYYYRSYAINQGGTSYGNQYTLSTAQTAPAQPSNLTPTGGIATDDLTPDLAWQYNPGSANDTQKDYQIVVTRQSDSVVMWDSGKITSANNFATYAGTTLAYNVDYQWKVKTWNQNDQESPYSSLVIFKTSQKPTVTLDYPTNLSSIASNTPTILWNYTDPEGTTQAKYRVQLHRAGTSIHDTGWVLSSAELYVVPDNILDNLNTYSATIEVEDAHGMRSVAVSNQFEVEFLAPTIPNVGATQDAAGVVNFTVELTRPIVDGWYADLINLYKREVGDINYSVFQSAIPVNYRVLDSAEDAAPWSESGVAVNATLGVPRYGTNSLNLGASGVGTAIYSRAISAPDFNVFDTFQAWVNVVDNTDFTSIDFEFGPDSSNYYKVSIAAPTLVNGAWNPVHVLRDDWQVIGTPGVANIDELRINLVNTNGAIPIGDVRVDRVQMAQSFYEYDDYTTAASQVLQYAANVQSIEAGITTGLAETGELEISFTEPYVNMYLLPPDNTAAMVRAFMDGTKPPNWTHRTETKYYATKGSSKPVAVINALQNYLEGTVELRFFDNAFGGQGLIGVRSLENIKNIKPILLRTWWGKNYFISIDGDLNTIRRPGIGWFVTFNFTEINS